MSDVEMNTNNHLVPIRAPETTNATPHRRSVMEVLPAEIQMIILGHATSQALKALRQAHRSWTGAATEVLFARISISKFTRDWDHFINISNDPGLAQFVKEVCWLETTADDSAFKHVNYYRGAFEPSNYFSDDPDDAAIETTRRLIADCTWVDNVGSIDYINREVVLHRPLTECEARKRAADVRGRRMTFNNALTRFPKLDSLSSVPMPGSHIVAVQHGPPGAGGSSQWQVTAAMLDTVHTSRSRDLAFGYWTFLYPHVPCLSNVKRLRLVDLPGMKFTSLHTAPRPLPVLHRNPFRHLTSLEVVLSGQDGTQHGLSDALDLGGVISQAENLTELRLDIVGMAEAMLVMQGMAGNLFTTYIGQQRTYEVFSRDLLKGIRLPRLQTLRLAGFDLHPIDDPTGSVAAGFLCAHAETLENLELHGCQVSQGILAAMRKEVMQLKSFTLVLARALLEHRPCPMIRGSQLAAYVNGKTLPELDQDNVHYSWGDGNVELEPEDLPLTGPYWPNDFSVTNPDGSAGAPDDWASVSFCTYAPGFAEEGSVMRDPDTIDVLYGDFLAVPPISEYAVDKEQQGSAPRWDWARDMDGVIRCWQTSDPDRNATECWLFRHHTGKNAVGDEPFEYFSDWDSDVDEAEPLPYCHELYLLASGSDPAAYENIRDAPPDDAKPYDGDMDPFGDEKAHKLADDNTGETAGHDAESPVDGDDTSDDEWVRRYLPRRQLRVQSVNL